MSVANISSSIVADVSLDFVYDENLLHIEKHDAVPVKTGKYVLGNIYGGKSKTFTIYFEPLTCAKASDIGCQINYRDHEGNMAATFMEPKEISVVCPIMKTDQDINIGRLKELIESLPSKDSRDYQLQSGFNVKKLATIAREAVEKHDVKHIRTLYSRDGKTCELWYYGRTKVSKDDIVINISIQTEHNTIELFAATQTAEALTGLLAEIGRDLKQTLEAKTAGKSGVVNLTIKDSVVQRSNLLDMCNVDGTCDVNVVVEGSVVQRSGIASADEEAKRRQEEQKREEEERLRREQDERERREQEELKQRKREEEERKRREGKLSNVQVKHQIQDEEKEDQSPEIGEMNNKSTFYLQKVRELPKLQILGWLFILYGSYFDTSSYDNIIIWDDIVMCQYIGIFLIVISEIIYGTIRSNIKKSVLYGITSVLLFVMYDSLVSNQIIREMFLAGMTVSFLYLAAILLPVGVFKLIIKYLLKKL
jgi:hypothetical protein